MRNLLWPPALRLLLCVSAPLRLTFLFVAFQNLSAAEPELNLLRPDSLVGWDHGDAPRGWRIEKGILTGGADATQLLSGWTLGDFTLSLRWSTAPGAAVVIRLPDAPRRGLISVALAVGDPAASIIDGTQALLFAGGKLAPGAERWHTARLERKADKLSIAIDGQELGFAGIDANRRFGLGLALRGSEVALTDLKLAEPAGEPIFNGTDLTGWWSPLGLDSWRAQDGAIECLNRDGNYLRSEKEYANFTLALQYKQSPHCNSGIGIRTPHDGWPSGDGMELQLQDEPGLDKQATFAIYGNLEPLARADRSGQWNDVVVKADGRMISGWVNGQLVQQANTYWHPELQHRHEKGWIGFQDHGGKIAFRNIRVLAAPDGPGLAAWYAPRTESGPGLLFERLINPERLSLADGIGSGVVESTAASDQEQTLAELKGPGAVVQIWRSKPTGHIAFYFDGQPQPAIACLANLLHEHAPHLAEETDPVLTCLPFARSLKITLRDAPGAQYRIEYATFGPQTPVETYQPGRPVLPRGWQAAIDYRQHQYGWGTHREQDPAPRTTGTADSLEPGQNVALVKLDGAGLVQWVKLQCEPALVHSNDLWLEATVDGEAQPAVSAPARYWFPALSSHGPPVGGPQNHYNFASVFRGGYTSMLAMPFAKGMTISARNTGQTALGRLEVVASVRRDAPDDITIHPLQIDQRMRLRGRFERAGQTHELAALTGNGRLVGMVWAAGPSMPAIAALTVDGQLQPGWTRLPAEALLGGWPGDENFYRVLGGRHGQLAWRYLLLGPVDFRSELKLTSAAPATDRLVLWYAR